MSSLPPPPPPEAMSQASDNWREIPAGTALSIILGALSLCLSCFVSGVYSYARWLWESSGEPTPGYNLGVDFWGQWKVNPSTVSGGRSRIVAIGGLVIFSSPLAILAIICGLAAIILGVIAFKRYKRNRNIGGMLLGIGGVAISLWILSLL